MAFRKATKSQSKALVAIMGLTNGGKTYTALSVMRGLVGVNGKIAVVDTEHGSAAKYSHKFDFDTDALDNDFHPNRYIAKIEEAVASGYDGLIVDSGSHEWSGKGGCLELHDHYTQRRGGNSYAAWADVTPLHNKYIEAILSAHERLHVIVTFRSKMDYIQSTDGARSKVTKVGMAAIQRDGIEYEFDVILDMDAQHVGTVTKTRCEELDGRYFEKPGKDFAAILLHWLNSGEAATPREDADLPEHDTPGVPVDPSYPAAPPRATDKPKAGRKAKPAEPPYTDEATEREAQLMDAARSGAPIPTDDDLEVARVESFRAQKIGNETPAANQYLKSALIGKGYSDFASVKKQIETDSLKGVVIGDLIDALPARPTEP